MTETVTAEVSTGAKVRSADGQQVDAVTLTCGEEGAIFTGPHAYERAVAYGRARYGKVNHRMHAEPGHFGLRGSTLQ